MYISARVDYAARILLVLADSMDTPVRGAGIAARQHLPVKVVENSLADLRRTGFVTNQRGADGGYRLARPANEIVLADVIRALEGPLAEVQGVRPDERAYDGPAEHLQDVWVAVRAALRSVLETVTLADILAGKLPRGVAKLVADPDAWVPRRLGPTGR